MIGFGAGKMVTVRLTVSGQVPLFLAISVMVNVPAEVYRWEGFTNAEVLFGPLAGSPKFHE